MENKKSKIVLIDDKYCANLLNGSKVVTDKFELLNTTDGKEGVKLVFEHLPDAVISDVTTPNGDIFYILEKLKKDPRTKDIPVIAFTTLCSADDKEEVEKRGASDYILKHECTPEKLAKRIEDILKNKLPK